MTVPSPLRILTVDLEDWFHLLDYDGSASLDEWSRFPSRIRRNTEFLLELFRDAGVRATFFSLGWIARTYPDLIRDILKEGHEIGSHSDIHTLVHQMDPITFRSDLRTSIRSIEDAGGQPVHYYRAPGFSITPQCLWAFEILVEEGITCDSSLFPSSHAHGGMQTVRACIPMRLETPSGYLSELPITVKRLLGLPFAVAGGGYFRLLPSALIQHWVHDFSFLMTYFHPRDFDAGQPILPGLSISRRFRAYVGLRGAKSKLKKILKNTNFINVSGAINQICWDEMPLLNVYSKIEVKNK